MRRLGPGGFAILAIVLLALALSANQRRAADADALVQRGEARLLAGDAEAALAAFQRAGARRQADALHLDGTARALEALGKQSEALARRESVALRARREGWPLAGRAAALRNLGLAAWRQARLEIAVVALQETQAIGAASLETDLMLGLARLQQGEAAAVEDAIPALRTRYGDVEPVWRLGLAASAPGAGTKSRAALEAFVGLRRASGARGPEGDGPIERALRADSLLDAGDLVGGAHVWAGLAGGPLASLAELGLAAVAQLEGRWEDALLHVERAATDAAVPRETLFYRRGQILAAAGRNEEARVALRRALAANPLSARSERLLAQVGP